MSYFNMVSHDPPTIMVSIQTGSKKYEDGTKGEPAVADPWNVHWAPFFNVIHSSGSVTLAISLRLQVQETQC